MPPGDAQKKKLPYTKKKEPAELRFLGDQERRNSLLQIRVTFEGFTQPSAGRLEKGKRGCKHRVMEASEHRKTGSRGDRDPYVDGSAYLNLVARLSQSPGRTVGGGLKKTTTILILTRGPEKIYSKKKGKINH